MVQSTYSSALDSSSSLYRRNSYDSDESYYEALVFSVDQAGSYNIRSRSDFDAYGFLYTDSFNPSYPSSNLLDQDDDSNENLQFELTAFLQSQTEYILVVTTFQKRTIGSFEIIASGPTSINFVKAANSIMSSRTTTATRERNSKCLNKS